MTTKQVLRLNKTIECLELNQTIESIVSRKICSKNYVTKVKKDMLNQRYIKYTSLLDGCFYWSEEIEFKTQLANYLNHKWDNYIAFYKDKTKLKNRVLSTITGLSEQKVSSLYGKSNDNLLLCDLDKEDEYDDDILEVLNVNNSLILKKFCKIKRSGIVSANKFSGYDLFSVSKKRLEKGFKNNNYCIINISERALHIHKSESGKLESINSEDEHFYSEMFFRNMAHALLDYIKHRVEKEGRTVELWLKYWTAFFIDEYDLTFNRGKIEYYSAYQNVVINMDFPNIIYYKYDGIKNLNDETMEYLRQQINDGVAYCHPLQGGLTA